MKKVLGIIGIGLVAGAAFSFLFNKKEKRKNNINTSIKDFSSDNTISTINQNDIHVENAVFEDVKSLAVRNLYTRHEEASKLYRDDRDKWNKMSAINIASSAKFSSDRTVTQYAEELWQL